MKDGVIDIMNNILIIFFFYISWWKTGYPDIQQSILIFLLNTHISDNFISFLYNNENMDLYCSYEIKESSLMVIMINILMHIN